MLGFKAILLVGGDKVRDSIIHFKMLGASTGKSRVPTSRKSFKATRDTKVEMEACDHRLCVNACEVQMTD